MKIAVCGICRKDAVELKNNLIRIWPETDIDVFYDYYSLTEWISQGNRCELLFLDAFVLYMKMPDGWPVIDRIRMILPQAEVVLTSARSDYGQAAFANNVFYYFVKPYSYDELAEIRKRFCIKHMEKL